MKDERWVMAVHAALFDIPLPIKVYVACNLNAIIDVKDATLTDDYVEFTIDRTGTVRGVIAYDGYIIATTDDQQATAGQVFRVLIEGTRRDLIARYKDLDITAGAARPSSIPCSSEQSGQRGWIARLFRRGRAA